MLFSECVPTHLKASFNTNLSKYFELHNLSGQLSIHFKYCCKYLYLIFIFLVLKFQGSSAHYLGERFYSLGSNKVSAKAVPHLLQPLLNFNTIDAKTPIKYNIIRPDINHGIVLDSIVKTLKTSVIPKKDILLMKTILKLLIKFYRYSMFF